FGKSFGIWETFQILKVDLGRNTSGDKEKYKNWFRFNVRINLSFMCGFVEKNYELLWVQLKFNASFKIKESFH
ncbi:21414_t:CDS:1, partial [Gigaspora margarita]